MQNARCCATPSRPWRIVAAKPGAMRLIADALTHIGQIAMLRRLAGAPVRGENYFRAEIILGRVGPEQSVARVEFD